MPWGRAILAVLATLFVFGGMGVLAAMGAGVWRPDFSSTPGVSPQDVAELGGPYEDISHDRDAQVIARLAESGAGTQAEIDRIQSLLPPGDPISSRLTAFRVTVGTAGNRLWGIREYEYPEHVVRAETALYRATASEPWKIAALNVNAVTRQELAARTFNLTAEPPAVLAVIGASILIPLFTLATFLTALFRPGLKPRWVWLLAIALGVGTIYADTASDTLSFLPISVQLFGAGATWSGSVFDGWVFSASTPFGAAAFWLFAPRGKSEARASGGVTAS